MPEPARRLRVVHFHRHPGPTAHSLERVFATVREHLPDDIEAIPRYCPRPSTGIVNRIVNILWARRNQGDVNHITGDVHYLALGLDPGRTILTIADCVSLHYSKGLRRWLIWLFWYWLPARRSARITAISQFTKHEILRYLKIKPDRIEVIHCPLPRGYKPANRLPGNEPPLILQIGTSRNKNLETLAESLRGVSCTLAIVGPLSAPQRHVLESAGIAYRHHVGLSDETVLALYESCDLVVFASFYEGFGLPIIEAQAIGRPVVTSNGCSMPDVAGSAACLVDPNEAASIRAGILRVMQDRGYRDELVRSGYENVKRFDPSSIAQLYANLDHRVSRQLSAAH